MDFYKKNYGEEFWLEHMFYHTILHDCHRVLPSIWELRAAMSSDDQNRLAEYINSPGIEATLEINFNTIKDNNKCTCWLCKRNRVGYRHRRGIVTIRRVTMIQNRILNLIQQCQTRALTRIMMNKYFFTTIVFYIRVASKISNKKIGRF